MRQLALLDQRPSAKISGQLFVFVLVFNSRSFAFIRG